jgi:hypothetical protein
MDNKLKEKLVNALKMGPGWVHLLLLVDTSLSHTESVLLDIWEGSENVLFNHGHDLVKVRNDESSDILLVLQHLLQLLDRVQSFGLK